MVIRARPIILFLRFTVPGATKKELSAVGVIMVISDYLVPVHLGDSPCSSPPSDLCQLRSYGRVINFFPMYFFHIHPLLKNITFMGLAIVII